MMRTYIGALKKAGFSPAFNLRSNTPASVSNTDRRAESGRARAVRVTGDYLKWAITSSG